MNPCLPHAHTAATLRAWAIFRRAHPLWHAKAVIPACVRVAALALPLSLPGAVAAIGPAYAPAVAITRPVLTGPAYEVGALFGPGFYGIPLRDHIASAAVAAVGAYSDRDQARRDTGLIATGGYPVTYTHTPGLTEIQPAQPVPEPSTLLLVAGLGVVVLLVRRWA